MAEVTANAGRLDPYKNFKFRVKWDGRYVAGVSRVSGIKRTTEVVTHREGADPSRVRTSPGQTAFEAITLERGLTHDAEFADWALSSSDGAARLGSDLPFRVDRKDLVLEMYNEAGQLVFAYRVLRAWVSKYDAIPELDADAHAVAIQKFTLQNEGWQQIDVVTEPVEPTLR